MFFRDECWLRLKIAERKTYRHNQRNASKSDPGNHKPCRPEIHPPIHSASPVCTANSATGVLALFLPRNDPIRSPAADSPNAANPAKLSLLCKKKKGIIAPPAPINIAQ